MYSVQYTNVTHPDPQKYIADSLSHWASAALKGHGEVSREHIEAQAAIAVAQSGPEPQLVSAEDLPVLDADALAVVRDRESCLLRQLRQDMPLQEGEVLEDDFFSFLAAPVSGLPERAVVLRRRTNMATLYVISDEWAVDHGELVFRSASGQASTPPPEIEPMASPIQGLASGLGSALLEGVQGEFAGAIIEAIFPSGEPSYFPAVYREIEKMFKRELVSIELRKLNGEINGLKNWMSIDYKNAKKSGKSKSELTGLLRPKVDNLTIKVIGVLQVAPFKEPGFATFLIAAGMHMALEQELALVDPDKPPAKSAHADDIKDYAKKYSHFAKGLWKAIADKRKSYCEVFYDSEVVCAGPRCTTKPAYRWQDKFTGYASDRYFDQYNDDKKLTHKGVDLARKAMERHIEGVIKSLARKLGDPHGVVGKWEKLEKHPLPAKSIKDLVPGSA